MLGRCHRWCGAGHSFPVLVTAYNRIVNDCIARSGTCVKEPKEMDLRGTRFCLDILSVIYDWKQDRNLEVDLE